MVAKKFIHELNHIYSCRSIYLPLSDWLHSFSYTEICKSHCETGLLLSVYEESIDYFILRLDSKMDFLQDVVFVFNGRTANSSSVCRIPNRFINIYLFLLVCSVVGTLCSALVIKILHKTSLQNPYEIYLYRMVILDLSVCSILIPTSVVFRVACIPSWIKALVYTVNSFAVGLSLNFLVGVAIQRVLAIKKPFTLGRNLTAGHRGSLICIMIAALKTALEFGRYIPGINMDQFAYANSMFGFVYFLTCFALVISCYIYSSIYIVYNIKRLHRKNAVEDGTTEVYQAEQITIENTLNISPRRDNFRNPANVVVRQKIKSNIGAKTRETPTSGEGRNRERVTPGTSVFGGGNHEKVTPGRYVVQPENNPNNFKFSRNVMKQNWITAVSHGKIEVSGDSNLVDKRFQMMYQPGQEPGGSTSGGRRVDKRFQMMYQPGQEPGGSTSGGRRVDKRFQMMYQPGQEPGGSTSGGRRVDKRLMMVYQSAITFTIVSCIFFVSRCPIFFGDFLNLFNATSLRVFVYLVNVINPFIYCFTCKKLQLHLKKKICCKRH